jgi:hypothetical protein
VTEENVAVEREIAKGTEPGRRIHQLISDDERHRGLLVFRGVTANIGADARNLTGFAENGAANFAFCLGRAMSCVFS